MAEESIGDAAVDCETIMLFPPPPAVVAGDESIFLETLIDFSREEVYEFMQDQLCKILL